MKSDNAESPGSNACYHNIMLSSLHVLTIELYLKEISLTGLVMNDGSFSRNVAPCYLFYTFKSELWLFP